jgi:hypothetical protein
MPEKIGRLAHELGVLGKSLYIMDPLPKRQMPAVLSASTAVGSTVIDNPVAWINSANKFFNALAAGRPVIINYGGWQVDLLRETGAGIVLPARDIESAGSMLIEILD